MDKKGRKRLDVLVLAPHPNPLMAFASNPNRGNINFNLFLQVPRSTSAANLEPQKFEPLPDLPPSLTAAKRGGIWRGQSTIREPNQTVKPSFPAASPGPVRSSSAPRLAPLLEYCLRAVSAYSGDTERRGDEIVKRVVAEGYGAPTEEQQTILLRATSTKISFLRRARITPKIISAVSQPDFLEMIWCIIVMRMDPNVIQELHKQGEVHEYVHPSRIMPSPRIRRLAGLEYPQELTLTAAQKLDQRATEASLRITEELLRYCPLPVSVLRSLADIVKDINASTFARYMATRGLFAPRADYRWDLDLLRFWMSASYDQILVWTRTFDYTNNIYRMDPFTRKVLVTVSKTERRKQETMARLLRREAARVFDTHSEEELLHAVSSGISELADVRRKMVFAIRTEYDRLMKITKDLEEDEVDMERMKGMKRRQIWLNPIVADAEEEKLEVAGGTVFSLDNPEPIFWEDCY